MTEDNVARCQHRKFRCGIDEEEELGQGGEDDDDNEEEDDEDAAGAHTDFLSSLA